MPLTKLHACAATTPAVRKILQTGDLPVAALARKYGISPLTVRKWRARDSTEDRSSARHHLLSSISPREEEVILELRRRLKLPLDDMAPHPVAACDAKTKTDLAAV